MLRYLVRIGMTAADRVRRLGWRLSRSPMAGVRALVLTKDGAIVLVRHSYTKGWHLPSGGVKRREALDASVMRELREEIGLQSGDVTQIDQSGGLLGRRPHSLTTFLVRDAVYRPRWSLEIEEVAEFQPDALPADLGPFTRRALAAYLKM